VKSLSTLKSELLDALRGTPSFRPVPFPERPWSELDLDEVAWVVQDYVNRNSDVIEDDNRLKDWLDSYRFRCATRK
jgi:hypothetical protein